jgi:FixJ family two-component response regulator
VAGFECPLTKKRLIAVVDDEAGVTKTLRRLLLSTGFDCETFLSGQDLL